MNQPMTQPIDETIEFSDDEAANDMVEVTDEAESTEAPAAMDEELFQQLRVAEAVIFAADAPVNAPKLQAALKAAGHDGVDIAMLVARLQQDYLGRGIELVGVAGGWAFRSASDMAALLKGERPAESRKPPRAATETLAIVAYHQPVTRAEIEAIRGVQVSRGTLDLLMEAGWIRPGRRRETPGRPVTWLTTTAFLEQFGLSSLRDLPGLEELKAAGLLDSKPVLATLPAEAEFTAAESDEAAQDNDHLPAGDEMSDEEWEANFAAEGEEGSEDDEQRAAAE